MNAVDINDVSYANINGTRFCIRKFRGFTTVRIGATALAALSPAAPILGALMGEGEAADTSITKALGSLGSSLATLDARQVETLARELTTNNGNVTYEQDGRPQTFTENSIDELFGGDIQYLFALMKEVITLNFGGLFTWLGTLFGNRAEEGQTVSLI